MPLSLNNYYLELTKATISRDFHRFFLIVNSCYKQSFIFLLYLHIYQLMDTHFSIRIKSISKKHPVVKLDALVCIGKYGTIGSLLKFHISTAKYRIKKFKRNPHPCDTPHKELCHSEPLHILLYA